jgi:hypothetical protein
MRNLNKELEELLTLIVTSPKLHLYWLETLSYLENRGAHKIIQYQPRGHIDLFLLQHAAEETRHAFFFKRQIYRLSKNPPPLRFLGKKFGRRYLDLLDLYISRMLRKDAGFSQQQLKRGSYYLTSYAIEIRANHIFETYEKVLKNSEISFSLQGILKEEAHHLQEMEEAIDKDKTLRPFKYSSCLLEEKLYQRLLVYLREDLEQIEK